jgi:hypothetical protein
MLSVAALAVMVSVVIGPKPIGGAASSATGKLRFVYGDERSSMEDWSSSASEPGASSTTVPPGAQGNPSTPAPGSVSSTVPRPAALPPTPSQPTAARAIPPLQNPSADIAPEPNFLESCSGSQYDDSSGCVGATLDAIANARESEGLGAMVLPGNWTSLSAEQQLFVATNLERTARGLSALSGMASALDQAAAGGAAADSDPSPPAGFGFVQWGANWAGAVGNPLEAIYFWMYDDGPGSSNLDCTAADTSGCWGHRDNVLLPISGPNCVMGAGYAAGAYRGTPSWTELLVEATGPVQMDFTS